MIDTLEQTREQQILAMITEHSPLAKPPSLREVSNATYCVIEEGEKVIACVKIKKHNWYLAEIMHLVVLPDFRRHGFGRRVVDLALEEARSQEIRIVQCTIREDNIASRNLFSEKGFEPAFTFQGLSGNPVMLCQRAL